MRSVVVAAVIALGALLSPALSSAEQSLCCEPFGQPGQIAMSPDGRFAYVSDADSTRTLLRDEDSGALTEVSAVDGGGPLNEMSKDGRFLYVGSQGGITTFARDAASGRLTEVGAVQTGGGYSGDLALSPDGRQVYRTNLNVLKIYDRNPQSGTLTYRGQLKDGVGGVRMSEPEGMAISADGRFVYVGAPGTSPGTAGITVLARSDDGGLSYAGRTPCCYDPNDLELSKDGSKLFVGQGPVRVFDRDKDTGALSNETPSPASYETGNELRWDGGLALTADGTAAYGVNFHQDSLVQAAAPAFSVERTYNDGEDGFKGLYKANSVALSPDGRFVYVAGGAWFWTGNDPGHTGTIAVLRRDRATNDLTFASLFKGQYLDGRPVGAPPPSVQINGGSDYTNDPDARLTIDIPRDGSKIEIANDGGFGDATSIPWQYDVTIPWTLASAGPDRLPKTVYVRIADTWGGVPSTTVYKDEIVLDQTAPTVVSARVHASRLLVKARDARSGVAKLQIASDRHHPGDWLRYSEKHHYSVGDGKVYVRVRDRARNVSRWRKAVR